MTGGVGGLSRERFEGVKRMDQGSGRAWGSIRLYSPQSSLALLGAK